AAVRGGSHHLLHSGESDAAGDSPLSRRAIFLLPALLLALAACGRGTGKGAAATPAKAAARPAPSAGIELRRGTDPQELVRIGARGVVIGPAGGPLARTLFVEPRQADIAW